MSIVPVCVLGVLFLGSDVRAEELFVAADGSDSAAGTMQAPFGSLERAQQAAAPGDTVWIRGGVYRFSGTSRAVGVSFTKSGTADKPIRYFAYQAEVPIFDLFELKPQERVTGLDVRCNDIHLRGLEVRGVRQQIVGDSWSVRVRGDRNVLERLNVHDGQAPGIFITSGASNLILNCDSHHNYDPLESGGNGDGFGCHSTGGDNVLRGCRAWANSDDGYDFINAPGTCTVERSWAFRNGFVPDTNMAAGNGAGFKSGGFGSPPKIPSSGVPRHVVRFNLAFRNRAQGFYANHHPGGLDFLNNTAFANGVNFDMLVEGGTSTHELHNNLAAGSGGTVMRFTGGDDEGNSWNLPVMVTNADFVSMDEMQAVAARQADGSLPEIGLMHLVQGSDLLDRGLDIGQPFAGSKPDLGAFEYGVSMTAPDAGVPQPDAGVDGGAADGGNGGAGGQAGAGVSGQSGGGGANAGAGAATGAVPGMAASSAGVGAAPTGGPGQGGTLAPAQPSSGPSAPAADGCSCRMAERRSSSAWFGVTGLLLAAWLARRRRTRRRTAAGAAEREEIGVARAHRGWPVDRRPARGTPDTDKPQTRTATAWRDR